MRPSKHSDRQSNSNDTNNNDDEQDRNPDLRDLLASILARLPSPFSRKRDTSPLSPEERNRRAKDAIGMALRIIDDDVVLQRENEDEDDFSLFGTPDERH